METQLPTVPEVLFNFNKNDLLKENSKIICHKMVTNFPQTIISIMYTVTFIPNKIRMK